MKVKKTNVFILSILALSIILPAVSCKSTPKDTPAEQVDPNNLPPDQAALDELDAAMAKTAEAREEAVKMRGQEYFPDEWDKAESDYEKGKGFGKDTACAVIQAVAALNSATASYKEIADKSAPLNAKNTDEAAIALKEAATKAEQSRKNAMDKQGNTYFASDWKAAEEVYKNSQNAPKNSVDEMNAAAASFNDAAGKYDDIAARSASRLSSDTEDARKKLQEAIAKTDQSRKDAQGRQANVYFPDDWKKAETALQTAKNAKTGTLQEIKSATTSYNNAANMYNKLASNSLQLQEKDNTQKNLDAAIARAEKSRQQAIAVNSETYFPDEWKNAEDKNTSAKNAARGTANEIKAATALYVSAANAYDDIAKKSGTQFTGEKNDASKALQAAITRSEQSRKKATDAKAETAFPNDWKNAETINQNAKNAKRATVAEMKTATGLYSNAADAYDGIVKKIDQRTEQQTATETNNASKALQAAITRAEQSRKKAVDVKAETTYPSEWKDAEAKNQTAQNAKRATVDEMKTATGLYTAAADAYDGIAKKGQAQITETNNASKALQAAITRAEQSRKKAADAKADTAFPSEWRDAEAKNQTAQNAKRATVDEMKAATGLYTAAANAYDDIAKKGQAQITETNNASKALQAAITRAEQSRKKAADAKADTAFPSEWRDAEAKNQTAQNAKRATVDEMKTATGLYTAAANAYDDIAKKGQAQITETNNASKALQAAITRAEQSRKKAADAKADTAFPSEWKDAEAKNQTAQNAKRATVDEMKTATGLYTAAADAYDSIAKKDQAQSAEANNASKALQAAITRAEQSRKKASDANAQTAFPSEWRDAEAKNQTAQNAKRATIDEMKTATGLYTAAANAYDDIAKKGQAQSAEANNASKALQAAITRAEQSRKKASDAKADTAFPSEWRDAEAKNQTAQNAKRATVDEMKAATGLYTAAANAYDDIAKKGQAQITETNNASKALQAAITRAEQSRKKASDAKADTAFPSEWRDAEAKNQTAQNAKRATVDEMKAATGLYTAAANAYDDIAKKGQALITDTNNATKALQTAITRAEQSRKKASDANGEKAFPSEWKDAEAKNQTAQNAKRATVDEMKAATGLYTAAANAYDDIAKKGQAQITAEKNEANKGLQAAIARADQSRKAASAANGQKEFPDDWTDAEAKNQSAKTAKRATVDEMKTATGLYAGAADAYDAIARKSIEKTAQTAKSNAENERQTAVNAKVNDTAQDDFNKADIIFSQAEKDFSDKAYANAADRYNQSAKQFSALTQAAEKKRNTAENAIKKAKDRSAESASLAARTGAGMGNDFSPADEAVNVYVNTGRFLVPEQETTEELSASANALLANPHLQEVNRQIDLAEKSYNEGQYDNANSQAQEAIQSADMSDEYIRRQMAMKMTDDVMGAVQSRFNRGNQAGAGYAETYQEAETVFADAREARSAENWRAALASSLRALGLLGTIPEGPILAAQYRVTSWAAARDCLWNIAAKLQIYNDPLQWRRIYEANRSKLRNPDNPDLIHPGMILDIPSIRGETRSGILEEQ